MESEITDIGSAVSVEPIKKNRIRVRAEGANVQRCKTLVCVLENPTNLCNITGVIRTADGVGVGKIYIISKQKFIYENWQDIRTDPKWISLSASASKWVYIKKFETTAECLAHLEKKNFTNIATSPHILGKDNISLTDGQYTQHHLAVWFGNESSGLSNEALLACKQCVQIPMCGIIESLNLCTCAGIVLFHIANQRRKKYMLKSQHSSTILT